MGFAASQARLLLLTARKSDLEFRAQQITNAEMMLAMQSEEIAREYSLKLSNQTIKYINAEGAQEITAASFGTVANGLNLQIYVPVLDEAGNETGEYEWRNWTEEDTNYSGPELLKGIINGSLRIMNNKNEEVDAVNSPYFSVCYNTADDAQADAEYRRKTSALQVKEKRLQMDLQQIEAQQKACDNEIESVKKVMDKNIDKTFKVFS